MSSPKAPKGPPRPPPPKTKKVPSTPPSLSQHMEHLQELRVENVRWFYKEEKSWIRFNGADSSLIETAYRQLRVTDTTLALTGESDKNPILIGTENDEDFPIVRGGLYKVNVLARRCGPIYWKEDLVGVLRGTWFRGGVEEYWEPLDEKDAGKIEAAHQEVVRSMGFNQKSDGTNSNNTSASIEENDAAIHKIRLGAHRVEWHDLYEVLMISESTGSKLAQKIGFGVPWKLHRGFHTAADMWDCHADVTHIVFLVHGIGQLLNQTGGIVHSRKKFREVVDKTLERSFQDLTKTERVEFFPVEWRSSLKLDEGIINDITPGNISGLRKVLNETTMDVMYYTSPFYREEIIKALRQQLNDLYVKFCQQNPSFEANNGKVSIVAHSLGSVIVHDLLTMWNSQLIQNHAKQADKDVAEAAPFASPWFWNTEKMKPSTSELGSNSTSDIIEMRDHLHQARLKVADLEAKVCAKQSQKATGISPLEQYSLKFKVESVFNLGSPLGVFLVMKGIRPRSDIEQHFVPASVCHRYYNIYDPADPVAYRLEPLIYGYYSKIPPVKISYYNRQTDRKTTDVVKGAGSHTGQWIKTLLGGFGGSQHPPEPVTQTVEYQSDGTLEMPKATHEKAEEILKDKKRLVHRLDYALDGGLIEYFTALTSHMSYWTSMDVARFMLNRIYEREETDILTK